MHQCVACCLAPARDAALRQQACVVRALRAALRVADNIVTVVPVATPRQQRDRPGPSRVLLRRHRQHQRTTCTLRPPDSWKSAAPRAGLQCGAGGRGHRESSRLCRRSFIADVVHVARYSAASSPAGIDTVMPFGEYRGLRPRGRDEGPSPRGDGDPAQQAGRDYRESTAGAGGEFDSAAVAVSRRLP